MLGAIGQGFGGSVAEGREMGEMTCSIEGAEASHFFVLQLMVCPISWHSCSRGPNIPPGHTIM